MISAVPTVFVVDDEQKIRHSLSRVLIARGYHVRSFESATAFLAEHHSDAAGCLILDICMPGVSGIELHRALSCSADALPVIFLTGMSDVQTAVEAMKEGAIDYLIKPIDGLRLFAAVERAFQRYEEHRQQLEIRHVIRQRLDRLTPRETEVMRWVIRGRLNKQIAAEMGVAEKTVKSFRANMMSKMDARNVSELVQLGACMGVKFGPALGTGSGALSWGEP